MNFKLKPLSLVALATTATLAGCGSETLPPKQTSDELGLWCPNPQTVEIVNQDFYALTATENNALQTAYATYQSGGGNNDFETWLESTDMFPILGLTLAEKAIQADKKREAKADLISRGQDAIFGENFSSWFDSWFDNLTIASYMGTSERLNKAGLATPAMDNQEICYTPPTTCSNYQIEDETGNFACVIPEINPLAEEQPDPVYIGNDSEAVIYYRNKDHVTGGDNVDLYKDWTIHAWNEGNCKPSYQSETAWGTGQVAAGIDDNYGAYWVMPLIPDHDKCGNLIVYNKTIGDPSKFTGSVDGAIPLGDSGNLVYHNVNKTAFWQDGFASNNFDGELLANQHPYLGAAAGGSILCAWGTEPNEAGDACIGVDLQDSCPAGTIAVGEGTIDVSSKCVTLYTPSADTPLHLRGGYNDVFNLDNSTTAFEYKQMGDTSIYRLNFAYGAHPAGAEIDTATNTVNHEFQIADTEMTEATTFGGIADQDPLALVTPFSLTVGADVATHMALAMTENTIYQFVMDASDPAANSLVVNTVPVAAFPVLTVGDADVEFEYIGNDRYKAQLTLTTSTVNVAIADVKAQYTLATATDTDLVAGVAVDTVVGGSGNISFTPAVEGVYDFIIDYSEPATEVSSAAVTNPTLKVVQAAPLGVDPVFIRGTMTGWGDPAPDEDEIVWDAETRTYSVIYGLEANGTHNFKFANQAWGGPVDKGGDAFTAGAESIPLTNVGPDAAGNISVTPTTSTAYQFSIDYNGSEGVLSVKEVPIYIRGGIYGTGDWAADETMRLNFVATDDQNPTEAGHTFTSTLTTTGPGFFKIADADWGGAFGVNYGIAADSDNNLITLGEPKQLSGGSDSTDISFQEPAGDYIFSFNDVTKVLTVTTAQ
ncbi:pullulanase-associated domain-containing protein [Algibacillus agarilyticus]|uniref:pullulanase-associated domain-containing protein n=1 Tax=Algibacillus agarilyticus TaxID=2234133 RepID=UPI000DD07111|nr:pullulanase-associated domain-containing protein [Algibacillus agarilyticus]